MKVMTASDNIAFMYMIIIFDIPMILYIKHYTTEVKINIVCALKLFLRDARPLIPKIKSITSF